MRWRGNALGCLLTSIKNTSSAGNKVKRSTRLRRAMQCCQRAFGIAGSICQSFIRSLAQL
eukprot:3328115-Alexandrium_andersonii.AAC.1